MPYELMIDFDLDQRLEYYASDIEATVKALDLLRDDSIDRDTDEKLRMVMLALDSIVHSLEQEANKIRSSTANI